VEFSVCATDVGKPDAAKSRGKKIRTLAVALLEVLVYYSSVPPVGDCGEWATPQQSPAGLFFSRLISSALPGHSTSPNSPLGLRGKSGTISTRFPLTALDAG
jgi:hypothetical protein